jgi:hypothetical protein
VAGSVVDLVVDLAEGSAEGLVVGLAVAEFPRRRAKNACHKQR